jgi:DNA repair photolyase
MKWSARRGRGGDTDGAEDNLLRTYVRVTLMGVTQLRWEQADEPKAQGSLFDEPVFEREPGRGEFRGIEFLHVKAHRLVNEVKGSPFGFRYTINAYRGCSHACSYCFARPTHTYLDLDADRDFERKIVVKVNAVSALRHELDPRRWAGDLIAMGTNTDPYQRAEGKYRLTRGIVEVLVERANPFSILTKSTLVLRDVALLAEAAERTNVRVNLSIGTLDEAVWRATEPGTPHPRRRVRAVEQLNAAGVPCGVLIAPVLPELSDSPEQLEYVVRACVDAGARSISTVLLHLRPGVKDVFLSRLAETHPHLVAGYRRRYRDRPYAARADQQAVDAMVRNLVRRYGGVTANGTDPRHHTGQAADADGAGAEVAVPPPRRAGHRSLAESEPTTTQLPLL